MSGRGARGPGTLAAQGVQQQARREPALGVVILADRCEPGVGGRRDVVEAHDGEVRRHPEARRGSGIEDPEGQDVARGQDRRRPRRRAEQPRRGRLARGAHAALTLIHRHLRPGDPGLLQRPGIAGQSRLRDRVRVMAATGQIREPLAPVGTQAERHDGEANMPEPQDVLGGGARGRLVIDADGREPRAHGLVDDDGRHLTRAGEREQGVVLGDGVDDDAVDHRTRQRRGTAVRDEEQAKPRLLGGRADPGDDGGRRGVVEGVGEAGVADQPDRPGPTAPQAAPERIGTRKPALTGVAQNALAQRRR